MENPITPLQAINQKELELRHRVHEARRRADSDQLAARQEAERLIARAKQEGQVEAEAFYQRGIEQAKREAEAVLRSARQEADSLGRAAAARFNEAARQIVNLVLGIDSSTVGLGQDERSNSSQVPAGN